MHLVSDEIQTYASCSLPHGHTYGYWTVEWWRWFLSIPKRINPAFDASGKFAAVKQPLKDIWFLAGIVGDRYKRFPKRYCKVPSSRSILFPVINCEINRLEHPELITDQDLIQRANEDENTIILKECMVDSKLITVERVKSDPIIFPVTMDEENAYGVRAGEIRCVADGYWVFLKPLPPGEHTISFRGACENGRLNSGADYCVQIEEMA
jgi:hypothetical protein